MVKTSSLAAWGLGLWLAAGTVLAGDAGQALSEGEIRRIDADSQRVTLRHGPIENLGMAAMTMRFTLVDGASLEGLAVGDLVRFRAEQRDGAYVVSELQRAD